MNMKVSLKNHLILNIGGDLGFLQILRISWYQMWEFVRKEIFYVLITKVCEKLKKKQCSYFLHLNSFQSNQQVLFSQELRRRISLQFSKTAISAIGFPLFDNWVIKKLLLTFYKVSRK